MKKGFTLIEILAVIVIVGIVAAIGTYSVTKIMGKAKENSLKIEMANAKKAADMYIAGNRVIEGETNIDLLDANNPINKYMKLSKDPWGNNYLQAYILINKTGSTITVDVYFDVLNRGCYKLLHDTKVVVTSDTCQSEYQQIIAGVSLVAPTLNELVPVTFVTDHWEKANIYSSWYDYENKNWANAVLLRTATAYNAGDTIPMNNIKGFFVWIPRYEYQIWNTGSSDQFGSEQAIGIRFTSVDTVSSGTAGGEYRTHPGFVAGSAQLPGFWVAKFEAGYDGAAVKADALVNSAVNPEKMVFVPAVFAWTGISPTNAFNISKEFDTSNALAATSHLIKNSEWGAVAYLSHSIYGKGDEVFINNSAGPGYSYYTGKSGGSANAAATINGTYDYDVAVNGVGASTTGNIYGVYDMNGGSHDIVAAKYQSPVGTDNTMDYYTSTQTSSACSGTICYGQALSETQYWYKDDKVFVWDGIAEWLMRGLSGMHGSLPSANSGLFAISSLDPADVYNTAGFRVTLIP